MGWRVVCSKKWSMATFFIFWFSYLVDSFLSYLLVKRIWRNKAVCTVAGPPDCLKFWWGRSSMYKVFRLIKKNDGNCPQIPMPSLFYVFWYPWVKLTLVHSRCQYVEQVHKRGIFVEKKIDCFWHRKTSLKVRILLFFTFNSKTTERPKIFLWPFS